MAALPFHILPLFSYINFDWLYQKILLDFTSYKMFNFDFPSKRNVLGSGPHSIFPLVSPWGSNGSSQPTHCTTAPPSFYSSSISSPFSGVVAIPGRCQEWIERPAAQKSIGYAVKTLHHCHPVFILGKFLWLCRFPQKQVFEFLAAILRRCLHIWVPSVWWQERGEVLGGRLQDNWEFYCNLWQFSPKWLRLFVIERKTCCVVAYLMCLRVSWKVCWPKTLRSGWRGQTFCTIPSSPTAFQVIVLIVSEWHKCWSFTRIMRLILQVQPMLTCIVLLMWRPSVGRHRLLQPVDSSTQPRHAGAETSANSSQDAAQFRREHLNAKGSGVWCKSQQREWKGEKLIYSRL